MYFEIACKDTIMKRTWRLLDTPPMTAAENMALDDALLELKGEGKTPNTIRFLQFKPRAVLLGYHQSVDEEIRLDYCRDNGIHINRRITGGGAIFFDESQLGWEIICEKRFFDVTFFTEKLFRKLCDPVIQALGTFGIQAMFRPRNDIEVNGRKISGTGGTESDGAFLFQGTLLTDFDADTMLKSLRIPVEKLKAKEIDSVRERVTCLSWELDRLPAMQEIKAAIADGFQECLGMKLESGPITRDEKDLYEQKLPYYASDAWINHVRPATRRKAVLQAAYKARSGMVRFTVSVDPMRKRITDIYITGDFLSFPARALFDLESLLRGAPLERGTLHQRVRMFFEQDKIRIPGMSWRDFLVPLDQVIEKAHIANHGIPVESCNKVFVTNGSFGEILSLKPSVLLLPYCAKRIDCELRYEKDCSQCGDCSVGDAWKLGLDAGLTVRTVVNFEDLMSELRRMKADDVPAFIGCCCEPFNTKHVDDYRRAGVPGILLHIDNTTCYELDQAKAAYAGKFERETCLDLDLLAQVMQTVKEKAQKAREDGRQRTED